MSNKYGDLIGCKYNYLTILSKTKNRFGNTSFICRCDCGNIKEIAAQLVVNGITKSCGCMKKKLAAKANTTHGMRYTDTYGSWQAMKKRCNYKKNDHYYNYGLKGIKVCDRWQSSFFNFYEDMGDRPNGCTLDRIDNSKGYCKDNCRWATDKQQRENRTDNCIIEYKGERKTCKQWSEIKEIPYDVLNDRFHRGDKGDNLFRPVGTRLSTTVVEYNGVEMNLKSLSKETGLSYSKLYYFIHDRKLSPYDAIRRIKELNNKCD